MNTIEDAARLWLKENYSDSNGKWTDGPSWGTVPLLLAAFHEAMCSMEGPSDEEIAAVVERLYPQAPPAAPPLLTHVRNADRVVFAQGMRYMRDHFPRSPKVADASLQGEGSSSLDLGDPLPPVGSDPSALATLGPEDGDRPKTAALQAPIAPSHEADKPAKP